MQLCLVSGEIIALSPPMTMMFEVEDLAVASPATVSRCGMIYMEPAALGIRALCVSWLQTLPQSFADFAGTLQEMFDLYVPHAVTFVRKQLTETAATVNSNKTFLETLSGVQTPSIMILILSCFFNRWMEIWC